MAVDQSRTILGPLTTTTFIPPPACFTAVAQCPVPFCDLAWQAQICNTANAEDNVDCWPPRSGSVLQTAINLDGWGFYSPGVVCPPGYTSACSATGGGAQDWPVQFSMFVGETAVGCCPSGFGCANTNWQTCISTVTAGNTFVAATCGTSATAAISTYLIPLTTTVPTTNSHGSIIKAVTVLSTYLIQAPLIQINWQSSDRLSLSSPASSSSSFSSSSSSASTTSAAIASTTPSSNISTASRVGFGVGLALAIVAIVALIVFFVLRYRRNRRRKQEYAAQSSPPLMMGRELPRPPHELGGTGRFSRRATRGNVYEMPGCMVPELPE